jgi:hypothetical protein
LSGDALTVAAYTWIPITLLAVWRARSDIPMGWITLCFAAFIVLCGITHAVAILTNWFPVYWFAAEMKALTGLVSITTAHAAASQASARLWHMR